MTLYKMVDGNRVQMSATEEQKTRDAWETNATAQQREQLKAQFIDAGLERIAQHVPELDTLDEVRLIKAIWGSITPTPALQRAAQIYLYVTETALPQVAQATADELDQIDPTSATPFSGIDPDDEGWPA